MENAIEIKNVSKTYNNFKLNNINMIIPKGSIVGLIGENGAGKTTTIKLILNLIRKESGQINIFDKDNEKYEKEIKENIGVVMDDSFLSDYLNPEDVNKIMKEFYVNWDEKQYFDYLEKFKLPSKKLIKDYSSGMKMKLKIVTALCHKPKLLVLDEPTSGLDPIVRSEILDIFREFTENEEHSILFSSHITSDLEHITDYISFIHEGSLILTEETGILIEDYGVVKCSKEEFEKLTKDDYISVLKNKYNYEVLVKDRHLFKQKYPSLVIDRPTIEKLMLIYIKGEN